MIKLPSFVKGRTIFDAVRTSISDVTEFMKARGHKGIMPAIDFEKESLKCTYRRDER